MTRKILRDYFPNYLNTDSLFSKMATLGAPWDVPTGQDMDDAYFTMYSGIKPASEFVSLHQFDGSINSLTIARILWAMYGNQWTKLWEAAKTKYVPINNYNVQETVVRSMTNDRNIDKTTNVDGSAEGTDTTTYGEKIDTTADSKSYTYGFNSPDQVPTGVVEETSAEIHSGTDTVSSTSTNTNKTVEATLDNDEENENITRNREGNVGQNSYQELLRQEFELWRWNYFQTVFEDCDKFLVLSVFDPCSILVN